MLREVRQNEKKTRRRVDEGTGPDALARKECKWWPSWRESRSFSLTLNRGIKKPLRAKPKSSFLLLPARGRCAGLIPARWLRCISRLSHPCNLTHHKWERRKSRRRSVTRTLRRLHVIIIIKTLILRMNAEVCGRLVGRTLDVASCELIVVLVAVVAGCCCCFCFCWDFLMNNNGRHRLPGSAMYERAASLADLYRGERIMYIDLE